MEWQPIETAPKAAFGEKDHILLVCDANAHPEDYQFEVNMAFWADANGGDFPVSGWHDWNSPEGSSGLWDIVEFTHWMPLPPPPNAAIPR